MIFNSCNINIAPLYVHEMLHIVILKLEFHVKSKILCDLPTDAIQFNVNGSFWQNIVLLFYFNVIFSFRFTTTSIHFIQYHWFLFSKFSKIQWKNEILGIYQYLFSFCCASKYEINFAYESNEKETRNHSIQLQYSSVQLII